MHCQVKCLTVLHDKEMKGNAATTRQVIVTVNKYNQKINYSIIIMLCGHLSIPWGGRLSLRYK